MSYLKPRIKGGLTERQNETKGFGLVLACSRLKSKSPHVGAQKMVRCIITGAGERCKREYRRQRIRPVFNSDIEMWN